ncbi:MAG: hypothetical protein M3O46_22585 [Myxococcota bacterium]|nr:hypothetical protein [Myxococcota bacterium]
MHTARWKGVVDTGAQTVPAAQSACVRAIDDPQARAFVAHVNLATATVLSGMQFPGDTVEVGNVIVLPSNAPQDRVTSTGVHAPGIKLALPQGNAPRVAHVADEP